MATASTAARLCRLACQRMPRSSPNARLGQITRQASVAPRAFTTSSAPWARGRDEGKEDKVDELEELVLKQMDEAFRKSATPEALQQLDELAKSSGFSSVEDHVDTTWRTKPAWGAEDRTMAEDLTKISNERPGSHASIYWDPDDPETVGEEHDEFKEDDITSIAHGKLSELRDMRHYDRLTVWEMPLLSKYAKPFTVPSDDQVLRWRYTTYMGEFHPAEKKVVVQFAPDDLKLTPVQTEKLKKLAGVRYNPETELVKMSCESFEHQAQNKRYLSGLVDDLVAAAKDPKDTFEDVPLDVRHHVASGRASRPRFPREWRMTPERRAELATHRQRCFERDQAARDDGTLVHGQKLIDEQLTKVLLKQQALTDAPAEAEKVPEPVMTRAGKSAFQKMAQLRR
ncbi:hypothetical protein S40285_01298 [Stachybotrys chlorohalonatus IBT 40285]|uniref:Small ribosomal subunit protein mS35 mitochondrial conserved domain-containing protein n=1 Tax=Stachybotrys chlorohalonatus (strain IBT 40285) TaxID=1283841 RepID=A0A084QQZ0_STAC4|nr:hypothetical protein S40285_01298 [Stachybotrys chlorohalonata IBT 40285]